MFGFATPEPMIGLELELGGDAGGCLELAKRMEPTSAWAVFGSFGIRVNSRVFPAWSFPFRRTINWVAWCGMDQDADPIHSFSRLPRWVLQGISFQAVSRSVWYSRRTEA